MATDSEKILSLLIAGELGQGQIARSLGVSRQTVAGIAYRARQSGKLPQGEERSGPRSEESKNRQRQAMRAHIGFETKTKPITQPKIKADEPEVLGPTNDFPPSGTCQYTRDYPNEGKPWRMCGHPGAPYCDWHLSNRIRRQEGYG